MFEKTKNLEDAISSVLAGLDESCLNDNNVAKIRDFARNNPVARLRPEVVENLFLGCMYQDGEATDASKYVPAMGEQTRTGFKPENVAKASPAIKVLICQLPDQFFADGFDGVESGGGFVFTQACSTWDGELWTGVHQVMDMLFCLGIAAGHVKKVSEGVPMPTGMNYYTIFHDLEQPELKTEAELMAGL